MLVHDIIPHHHHDTISEAEEHHLAEQAEHHHHDGMSDAHDHTMHFVHSSDFGNYLPSTNLSVDLSKVFVIDVADFLLSDLFHVSVEKNIEKNWIRSTPPPLLFSFLYPYSFRGPPAIS